jgi:hypothetical protein
VMLVRGPAEKRAVKADFSSALVMTVEEAKGLEFGNYPKERCRSQMIARAQGSAVCDSCQY